MDTIQQIKLQNSWTFYIHSKTDKQGYGSCIRIIDTIDDNINFAKFIKTFPEPSQIFTQLKDSKIIKPYIYNIDEPKKISAISIFKYGIKPEWEDIKNINGGELQLRIFNSDNILERVNLLWYKLILCILSVYLTEYDYITGIRIVDNTSLNKITYRFEIWFEKMNIDQIKNLEKELILCLGLKLNEKFTHKEHIHSN